MLDVVDAGRPNVDKIKDWKESVLKRDNGRCVNCERKSHISACFVIPPEAGGRIRTENGVTLCRECRVAADGARVLPVRIDNKTPINFLMSRRLHDAVDRYAKNGSKFGSISALVRRQITSFIVDPELYEDIRQWQDDGSDVKVNGWVDGDQYEVFKRMCQERGLTYTDALKALLLVAIDGYKSDN